VKGLKLFVLGEHSPDPEEWCAHYRAIVIAHDEKEALALHDGFYSRPREEKAPRANSPIARVS
jgi:hypothetical protein